MTTTHPDQVKLLQAICEIPADDVVRGAYADWLSENGDPDRGEFIRVQCELARLEAGADEPVGDTIVEVDAGWKRRDERIDALRRRERELFENGHTYRWGFPKCVPATPFPEEYAKGRGGGSCGLITRGFVGAVTASLADLFGGPCRRCEGTGVGASPDVAAYVEIPGGCPTCHGTGTVPGCAAELFGAQPVERVTIAGAEPQDYHNNGGPRQYGWWMREQGDALERACDLPAYLWERVAKAPGAFVHGFWADFKSHTGATEALCAAAVAEGRARAPFTHECPGCGGRGDVPSYTGMYRLGSDTCRQCKGVKRLPGLPPLTRTSK